MMRRIHGVEDILLGFEPKDAGSIPAGSVVFPRYNKELHDTFPLTVLGVFEKRAPYFGSDINTFQLLHTKLAKRK